MGAKIKKSFFHSMAIFLPKTPASHTYPQPLTPTPSFHCFSLYTANNEIKLGVWGHFGIRDLDY